MTRARADAADRYPLPKIVRPRVVRDPLDGNVECTVERGCLRQRVNVSGQTPGVWLQFIDWHKHGMPIAPLPKRVAVWADLLANPTEEVEDDGTDSSGSPVSEAGR